MRRHSQASGGDGKNRGRHHGPIPQLQIQCFGWKNVFPYRSAKFNKQALLTSSEQSHHTRYMYERTLHLADFLLELLSKENAVEFASILVCFDRAVMDCRLMLGGLEDSLVMQAAQDWVKIGCGLNRTTVGPSFFFRPYPLTRWPDLRHLASPESVHRN
jgi:hypothetical protein